MVPDLQKDSVLEHIFRQHGDWLHLEQGFSTRIVLMAKLESLSSSFLPKFRKLFSVY